MMKPLVYVAGPYTKGDVAMNVRAACAAGERLTEKGLAVFIPHLTHFWHFVFPHPYEFWLAQDDQILYRCNAVLRLPGESSGADKETATAERLGIPVFTDEGDLVAKMSSLVA